MNSSVQLALAWVFFPRPDATLISAPWGDNNHRGNKQMEMYPYHPASDAALPPVHCQGPRLFRVDRAICSVMYVAASQGCFLLNLWTLWFNSLMQFLEEWPCLLIYSSAVLSVRHLSSPRIKDMRTWSIDKPSLRVWDAGVASCSSQLTN